MSSNTLRGIGQKGADKDAAGGTPPGKAQGNSEDKPPQGPAPGGKVEAKPEPAPQSVFVQDFTPLRSLDSTVPGTRSLDASVPGATPSLDAKLGRVTPPMAQTLIGMAAPKIIIPPLLKTPAPSPLQVSPPAGGAPASAAGRRDIGTAVGRDVHLPPEVQRAAGLYATSGVPRAGVPQTISGTESQGEPTDPMSTSALDTADTSPRNTDELGVGSHLPWYDQLPHAEEVYDDPKPNIVARVAVGVAGAAAVAILVLAFVRMRGHSEPEEATETQAAVTRPVTQAPKAAPVVAPPPPTAPVAAVPPDPVAAPLGSPPPPPAPVVAQPSPAKPSPQAPSPEAQNPAAQPSPPAPRIAAPVAVAARVPAAEAAPTITKPVAVAPREMPATVVSPAPPRVAPPRPQTRPVVAVAAPVAKPATVSGTGSPTPPRAPSTRPATATPASLTTRSTRPLAASPSTPRPPTPAIRKSPVVATAPAAPASHPALRPTKSPDRSKQKLTDPDSTLPLSLD